ncbi:MAG: Eco57I restriction-modification methylase domain-containing protein [Clostridia bacterium]|nr:Eco57I restriction-modification methylase domain-containing protein [Clostridia bacterium]
MKFDFVIGNPPYQEETLNNGRQSPVYHKFMEESYKISNCVELITPARFLFNAGQTTKSWNEKMLKDKHFKVLQYEADASKVFMNTEIKGGIAITIRNSEKNYGAIEVFLPYDELKSIINTIFSNTEKEECLDGIVSSRGCYRTNDTFYKKYTYASSRLGNGTGNMIASNFFERLPEVNDESKLDVKSSAKMLCRINNERTYCYIKKDYLEKNEFLKSYNVAVPKSSGSGEFGEVLAETNILEPWQGATDTFISIGIFNSLYEAKSLQKYLKTKFLRTLLGIKKVTQDNPKGVWSLIPILDFTENSHINWSKSVKEIDKQLYKKYKLSKEEIEFIETHVKEME